MTQIQEEIAKVLVQLSEKTLITEAAIAKKLRENIRLEGKNKASLAFKDVEEAVFYVEENNEIHFSMHVNSANDLLLKPASSACALEGDARKRRLAGEKSMTLLTGGDIKSALERGKSSLKKPLKKHYEKKNLSLRTADFDLD